MTDHLQDDAPLMEYPNLDLVVRKSIMKNITYRDKVLDSCEDDLSRQQEQLRLCGQDSLYWLMTFVWIFEPRPRPRTIPFLMWPHQIPVWSEMERWLGVRDVGLEKSRGEGASWMILMLCLHKWLFMDMFTAGFVSKDENTVDDPGDSGSMFWKLDFVLGTKARNPTLPEWMIPAFTRNVANHTFVNNENNATLAGYAATANVATGARSTVFVMDELSKFPRGDDYEAMNSTFPVTDCRYLISSPYGPEGAYYDAMHSDSAMIKLRLHWTDNPSRNRGLYRVEIDTKNDRRVKLIDTNFWKDRAQRNGADCHTTGDVLRLAQLITDGTNDNPFSYQFMTTGQFVKHGFPRSPWYDSQCRRPNQTHSGIAQELDIDYGGAASRFFDINMLMRLQDDAKPPLSHGEMIIPDTVHSHLDLKGCRFEIINGGRLGIWFTLKLPRQVPHGRSFVVGADVSAGTSGVATSNSTICVLDRVTGEEVAELATPNLLPEAFADYCVSVCYWFTGRDDNPAQLIWEQNGSSGAQFGKRISDLAYPFIYYRGSTEETVERETSKMGFWSSGKTKPPLLGELGRAMERSECVVRSYKTLEECKYYMNLAGDKIEHIGSIKQKDPGAAAGRHGDRVIALALAWWVAKEYIVSGSSLDSISADVPDNCALGRRKRKASEPAGEQSWVPPSQKRSRKSITGRFQLWKK